jgi:hypothetical protein
MPAACALVYLTMGEPPPILSYAAVDLGARLDAIILAMGPCSPCKSQGRRMISLSLKSCR